MDPAMGMDAEVFLSETISILAASPDFRATIENLSVLANSTLSDWCGVFMFESEVTLRRLLPYEGLYPLNIHASWGPGYVLRTGQAQLLTDLSDEVLASLGLRPNEAVLENGHHPTACLCLPLIARGRAVGAMALLSAGEKADAAARNLPLAQALANAAAVALDNAELYRRAKEANRLKDEFVAMVSHELRTPLTPILGCIHLLRTAKLSQAKFDRALEMIERNAQTQVHIVEDLLDASRIVAGKLHLVLKSVQLAPVLEEAVASVRALAEGKGVKIVTTFEEIHQPIDGDAHRLQQIMWHLLSNAVKFTPPEGRIEVSARSDHDQVVLQVTDTGIGIPADLLPHIFDRFRQAASVDPKTRSGLGLGLAIVRHLVELHSGSIEAASAGRGSGAVFTLKFPFAARKAAAVPS
jgi:signal transduction histidine kinase